jgi:PAS domain S-box-containing protein
MEGAEIEAERKRAEEALQDSEEQYRVLFEQALDGIGLADIDTGILLDCNQALANLVGRNRTELIGQHQSILHPPSSEYSGFSPTFKQHITEKEGKVLETQVITKTGEIKEVEIKANLLYLKGKKMLQGIFSDVTDRKKAEDQIRKDLEEKEVLLKEIHHRVKNNLTVISSLLNLQSRQIKTKQQALAAFKESRDRVFAMALVHEKLYQTDNFSSVDMKSYLDDMSRQLVKMYHFSHDVHLKLNVNEASIDINRAIPCGLILNELITNALKYAFPQGRKGEITVSFRPFEKTFYELVVSDNGVGLPDDLDIEKSPSLGLHLVRMLTSQLNGTWRLSREKGTSFTIRFPKKSN